MIKRGPSAVDGGAQEGKSQGEGQDKRRSGEGNRARGAAFRLMMAVDDLAGLGREAGETEP